MEQILTRRQSAVVVEVGTLVDHMVDRKVGLRTIVGAVEGSNPPVLVVDLQPHQGSTSIVSSNR